ncbi:MAG: preprotein translocase subunit SecE [Steroidobacteraceae bacterium]
MTDTDKTQAAPQGESFKLGVAVLAALGGLVAFYMLKGNAADWMRWLAFAAGLALGALLFAWSQHGRDMWKFALDSRIELRKIVWPTRDETLKTTALVFVFVIILAIFFWALDLGLAALTRLATGQEG